MFIGSSYNLKNKICDHPVLVNNQTVPRIDAHKCLGVLIDEKRSWEKHIETICKKAGAGIGALRRAKPFVPADTLQVLYKALVQPYFRYSGALLWNNLTYEPKQAESLNFLQKAYSPDMRLKLDHMTTMIICK